MTDLRTRIATAIMQTCHGVYMDDAVNAADAVIRELRPRVRRSPVHRYITDWIPRTAPFTMSDLRTRIAAALVENFPIYCDALEMADVLIRELGLTQQWTWTWMRGNGERDHGYAVDTREEAIEESGEHYQLAYRYVTEWEQP